MSAPLQTVVPARRETLIAPSLDERIGPFSLRTLARLQWVGTLVAPLVWIAQHVFGYGLGEAACHSGGMSWGIGYDVWQLTLLACAGLAIVVSEAAAVAVYLHTRGTNFGDGPAGEGRWDAAVPYTRIYFFAVTAMLFNLLFLTAVLLDGLASVFAVMCAQS